MSNKKTYGPSPALVVIFCKILLGIKWPFQFRQFQLKRFQHGLWAQQPGAIRGTSPRIRNPGKRKYLQEDIMQPQQNWKYRRINLKATGNTIRISNWQVIRLKTSGWLKQTSSSKVSLVNSSVAGFNPPSRYIAPNEKKENKRFHLCSANVIFHDSPYKPSNLEN